MLGGTELIKSGLLVAILLSAYGQCLLTGLTGAYRRRRVRRG